MPEQANKTGAGFASLCAQLSSPGSGAAPADTGAAERLSHGPSERRSAIFAFKYDLVFSFAIHTNLLFVAHLCAEQLTGPWRHTQNMPALFILCVYNCLWPYYH